MIERKKFSNERRILNSARVKKRVRDDPFSSFFQYTFKIFDFPPFISKFLIFYSECFFFLGF